MSEETLSNLLHEERRFAPSAEFAAAGQRHADATTRPRQDRLAFWEKQAERLDWATPWTEVLDWPTRRSPSGSSAAS